MTITSRTGFTRPWMYAAVALLAVWCSASLQAQEEPAAPGKADAQVATSPSAKAGAILFSKSGCPFCHGPQGNGTDKAPSIHDVRKRRTDEEIFHQIQNGGTMMPPFAEALTESEIRSLVLFLRTKDGWQLLPTPQSTK